MILLDPGLMQGAVVERRRESLRDADDSMLY